MVRTSPSTCGKYRSKTDIHDVGHPVHSKDETEYTKVLRKFDLSYEFGPCVGVSRLERWKRAEALGLEPPVKVCSIACLK